MFVLFAGQNAPDENVDDERLLRTTAQVEKVLGKDYSPIDKKQLVRSAFVFFSVLIWADISFWVTVRLDCF